MAELSPNNTAGVSLDAYEKRDRWRLPVLYLLVGFLLGAGATALVG